MPGQQSISGHPDGTFSAACGLCQTDPPGTTRTTVGTGFATPADASAFLDQHARDQHKFHGVVTVPAL